MLKQKRDYDISKIVGNKKTDFVNMQIRKIAIPTTELIAKYTLISPNQISAFNIPIRLLSLLFISLGGYYNILIGSILMLSVSFLDHLDGKLSRVLNIPSLKGKWLDEVMDLVYLPLVIVSLAIGLNSYLIGMIAAICYPIHFMLCFIFKADFQPFIEKNEAHLVKKESKLRFLYGGQTLYHVLFITALFGIPKLTLYFFASFGNLFWIAIMILQYRVISKR